MASVRSLVALLLLAAALVSSVRAVYVGDTVTAVAINPKFGELWRLLGTPCFVLCCSLLSATQRSSPHICLPDFPAASCLPCS